MFGLPIINTHRLEAWGINAWPARETILYDGWLLRFNDGYTRRANSVQPLYPSTIDLRTKITACERLYADQGLATTFKMTKAAQPPTLDETLETRGYVASSTTHVYYMALDAIASPQDFAVSSQPHPTDAWIDVYSNLNDLNTHQRPILKRMVLQLSIQKAVHARFIQCEHVAVLLAVRETQHVAVFGLAVHPAQRRQRLGYRMMQHALHWAASEGAQIASLQVTDGNTAARALYEKMGFHSHHIYWYRSLNIY